MQPDEVRPSYDIGAETYAQKFFDELSRKPFDRRARPTNSRARRPGHVAATANSSKRAAL